MEQELAREFAARCGIVAAIAVEGGDMLHWRNTIFLPLVALLLVVPAEAQQSPAGGFTILLSNDDGYDAPGLRALIEALRPAGVLLPFVLLAVRRAREMSSS